MVDELTLVERITRHSRLRPDAPALVWHEREVSYGELHGMARRAHDRIDRLGLAPGEPVGVDAAKSPETVALILACLLARRPFLLPGTALAEQTRATLLAQAGCRYVLSADGTARAPRPTGEGQTGPVAAETPADGVSFMLTTSGSTGLPKIVPLGGDAVDRFVAWAGPAFGIGPGVSVLNYAPLSFDLCLLDVWTTLAHGGRVVLVDPDRAADGRHLLDLLARHRIQVVQAVPMFFGLLLGAAGPQTAFDTVERVLFTGDAIGERTLAELPRLFPAARLYNVYGCTETNDSFVWEAPADPAALPAGPVPIGTPLPGVRAFILDERGDVLTGPGTGELYVSTPFQTAGYLGRARHSGKFGPHPLGEDDRTYFRTGDLVRRDAEGRIHLVGRSDFQVKVRGVAINTAEVERVLMDHPEVLEAAVVAEPDPLTGRRLLAVVRRAPASRLNSLVLREHCARRLPKPAVPAVMRIVGTPLPKTTSGKVDRNAAKRLHESPRPERRVS